MTLKIDRIEFEGWKDAYRLTLGKAEMIVLAEVGPRIISLRVGDGQNLLFVDPATKGKGQADAVWHIYGGHRIWQSPESEDAYSLDNKPCGVQVSQDKLVLTTAVDPDTKLRKRLAISAQGDRFLVESAILNTSDFVNSGGVWALTCVAPQGTIAFPWGTSGNWAMKRITWWAQWADHTSNVKSAQYSPGPDLFLVRPTGEEGKVGTFSLEGWVALCRRDATFVKSFRPQQGATYPDDGCCLEVYTSAAFIEMETLSPTSMILPGQEICHQEVWTVTDQAVNPEDGQALRALLPG